MHPAFSRFTKFPESLREAAAFVSVPGGRLSGMGCTAAGTERNSSCPTGSRLRINM